MEERETEMQRRALARERELRRETLTKEMEWKRLKQDYQNQISNLQLMVEKEKKEADGLRLKSSTTKGTGFNVTFVFFISAEKLQLILHRFVKSLG